MGFILVGGVTGLFTNLLSFGNFIVYFAIIIAVGALAFTQKGLTKGKASILVPAYNSFYIIIPLISEMLIFYNFLSPFQMIGIFIIIIGIILMTAFKQEELDE